MAHDGNSPQVAKISHLYITLISRHRIETLWTDTNWWGFYIFFQYDIYSIFFVFFFKYLYQKVFTMFSVTICTFYFSKQENRSIWKNVKLGLKAWWTWHAASHNHSLILIWIDCKLHNIRCHMLYMITEPLWETVRQTGIQHTLGQTITH